MRLKRTTLLRDLDTLQPTERLTVADMSRHESCWPVTKADLLMVAQPSRRAWRAAFRQVAARRRLNRARRSALAR